MSDESHALCEAITSDLGRRSRESLDEAGRRDEVRKLRLLLLLHASRSHCFLVQRVGAIDSFRSTPRNSARFTTARGAMAAGVSTGAPTALSARSARGFGVLRAVQRSGHANHFPFPHRCALRGLQNGARCPPGPSAPAAAMAQRRRWDVWMGGVDFLLFEFVSDFAKRVFSSALPLTDDDLWARFLGAQCLLPHASFTPLTHSKQTSLTKKTKTPSPSPRPAAHPSPARPQPPCPPGGP